MPWAVVAAQVVNAGIQSSAARSAARRQQAAADNATALQRDVFERQWEAQEPYRTAGVGARGEQQRLAGEYATPLDASQLAMSEPGYQFGLQQGLGAIQNTAAAQGGLYSGATGKALTR